MMDRILVLASPEPGHLRGTLGLAHAARGAGFDVQFAGLADSRPVVADAGFEYLTLFEDLFPSGALRSLEGGADADERQRRAMTSLMDRLIAGGLRDSIRAMTPQLCLVHAHFCYFALSSCAEGIPTAIVHTGFSADPGPVLPPVDTTLVPSDDWRYRAKRQTAIWRTRLREMPQRFLPGRRWMVRRVLDLAVLSGYPLDGIRTDRPRNQMLTALPEIILCPPELEFPQADMTHRHYLGPFETPGTEVNFPWARLNARKRLVYCALGSYAKLYGEEAMALFRAVATLPRLRPDLQVVIAAGVLHPAITPLISEDVVVVRTAPQLALLQRAAVFVTHGGLNSVREAILNAVPMVAFPMGNSQPGTAARLAYHRLGVLGRGRDASSAGVLALIDRVLTDDSYRSSARRMQETVLARMRAGTDLRVLRQLISAGTDFRLQLLSGGCRPLRSSS
jgi:UDP:flavonoid glycosyltransferase YjiC (YdhE family)